ncbi:Homogentisate geranylgeranyltransferase [Heracleum sosnowskyi]|uniref:Homogentisate geranylgeranyltransferase n=1 Tax=Heracleum sosnowskyi TaxID=360622 RepID=A0AAD8MML5_9APIA|nr:Homogentisate geranylgeranyltransferase [Heracleum sosnowskyi]
MIQTIKSSSFTTMSPSFSSRIQHGFPTSFHLQRRQRQISNKYKENKYFINFLPPVSISKGSFGRRSSGPYKPVREKKVQTPTFCAQSTNDEFILKDDHITTLQSSLWRNVDVFLRFCRLHSVIGNIIGILKVMIPMVLMNVYVGCLNQVTDLEIDKVNKPHFVLVTGEYTVGQAKAIAAALALMAFTMGILFNSPSLFAGLVAYFLVGTAYSVELPLLRWKKNPFLAAFVIISLLLSIASSSYIHSQTFVLGRPLVFTRPFAFILFLDILFGIVVALMKDIPDVDGDRAFGIQTFSIMHGKRKVFDFCISILLTVYGVGMLIGALSSSPLNKLVTVFGHGALGFLLWTRSQSLNLDDKSLVESFYMFTWKLLYVEYLLIHFLR